LTIGFGRVFLSTPVSTPDEANAMPQSTKVKPEKPRADFPLFPHASGVWAKKVRGKLHYFGPWADPQAALEKWADQKDDLLAGRTPRHTREGVTVRDLANHFLTAKQHLVDSGELVQRTWDDYYATCERVVKQFGATRFVDDLRTTDFDSLRASIAKNWGPVAVGNEVQRVRVLFKYGYDAELLDKTVRFGPGFKRPSKKSLRNARHAKGPRMFTAPQIRSLADEALPAMKAMILLGINCGFGNTDVGSLTFKALDLDGGWVNHPRTKTGIMRRCPLWKETISALRAAIKIRPSPRDEANGNLVFLTKYKTSWAKANVDNPVSKEMYKLVKSLGMSRPGLNFYALRHTFETIGGETKDQPAVSHIMGHSPASGDMSAVYRESISDDRLKAVTEHVRKWLFTKAKSKGTEARGPKT
jgi:integrase